MKSVIRASRDPQVSEREKKNRALARRACEEGAVLLKNDGVLPLRGHAVALYGRGVRRTQFGGTGSGEVRPRETVNIEQGFLRAGYSVLTQDWLDKADAAFESAFGKWEEEIRALLSHRVFDFVRQFSVVGEHPFRAPYGGEIERAEDTETAVYVLTRQAGEGQDRKVVPGDFLIAEEELAHLRALKKLYEKVVLVINAGGMIDLSFDDELHLNAIVYLSQGGMEAGNALASLLSGKSNFCGKLSDSWAASYAQYPWAGERAAQGGDRLRDVYREGIFVGYKWFEGGALLPRYPFGFGLSYSAFEISQAQLSLAGGRAVFSATVTNTGDVAGKEVVQLYAALPAGSIPKELQRLVAFVKTPLLQAGASCKVQALFELSSLSSYFEEDASYKIEKGDYLLRAGTSSQDLSPVAVLRFAETVVAQVCRNICRTGEALPCLVPAAARPAAENVPVLEYKGGVQTRKTDYTYAPKFDERVEALYKKLRLCDKVRLVNGAGFLGRTYNKTFGAIGRTTSKLVRKGIPNICMCDGPQGLNLTPRAVDGGLSFVSLPVIPQHLRYGIVQKMVNLLTPKEKEDSAVYYQYCTQFPCETLLAQSWDTELLKEIGKAVGQELLETGATLWLAPGMNLHRNPLCGRNFEYFSEDPLLTGKLAAALSQGVNACGGVGVTLKHFACNNREEERQKTNVVLSERALRETYLFGFGIAVHEGNPKAVMTSYNLVNGTYAANSYDLCTCVLRCEWGFAGLVMTDWYAAAKGAASAEKGVGAGVDLLMPGSSWAARRVARAARKGMLSERRLAQACKSVLRTITESAVYSDKKDK